LKARLFPSGPSSREKLTNRPSSAMVHLANIECGRCFRSPPPKFLPAARPANALVL
jgi:hypothetical protein